MTTKLRGGQRYWTVQRDSEGHRTYKIKFLVEHDTTDGPANIIQTPGLPTIGSLWVFDDDVDVWAWCRPDAVTTPLMVPNEPCTLTEVEMTFSTTFELDPNKQRRQTDIIQDPLLEPAKVNGKGVKYTEEKAFDKDGVPITTSSFELLRGPQVEFDANRDTITIQSNLATFDLIAASYALRDTVNAFEIWGQAPRTVKLSQVNFERKYHGVCSTYFDRTLEFDVDNRTFDRNVLDEGTKALKGHWEKGRVTQGYTPGVNDLTATITVGAGGSIASVSMTASGAAYPKNAYIGLLVKGNPSGTCGVIRVITDANGVPIAQVPSIYSAGSGYSAGAVQTTFGLSWALELIDGSPPQSGIASHYSRYKDQNGENARVVLDGHGLPVGAYYGCGQTPGSILVQYYPESDFTTIFVPVVFDDV
jgi:hypothetical protein